MSLAPALGLFLAAVTIMVLTAVSAFFYGKHVHKRKAPHGQDIERGISISAPILSAPTPTRKPNGLLSEPTDQADRAAAIKPLPKIP